MFYALCSKYIRSLLFWLGLINLVTALARMPVLGWFAHRRRDALAGVALAGVMLVRGRAVWWALPLALPLQVAAASVRGLWQHPRRIFAAAQVVALPLADGATLPGLLLFAAQPNGAGVVVCHGAGNDKIKYAWRMVAKLHEAGLTVLAIDLDGHGENQRRLRVPGIEENVAVAVAFLRDHCERVGVVGVSLGGCVAARAVADGVLVDCLALIEAPAAVNLAAVPYVRSELRGLLRPIFWRGTDTPLQLFAAWGGRLDSEHGLSELFDLLDLRSALPRIACPTLLLYGTADVIAPYVAIQPLLATMPNATLHLHGGASHLSLTMEPAPLEDLAVWLVHTLR